MIRPFLTAATLALLAAPAFAQDIDAFDRTDVDADRELSGEEFGQLAAETFDEWDDNEDGRVDVDEFSSRLYVQWDSDGDGTLTRDEFVRGWSDWMGGGPEPAGLDADQDDQVTREEVRTGIVDTSVGEGDVRVPWRWEGQPQAGWLDRTRFNSAMFHVYDIDGNGIVSRSEYEAVAGG